MRTTSSLAPQPGVHHTVAAFPFGGATASLSLSMLLSSLGISMVHVSLPTLAQAFGATFQDVQWTVLAYLVTLTSVIVSAGRLGDLWGRRRLLLVGLLVFTAGSLLGGLSSTLGLLIAARAVQGLGAAVMMAMSLALVGETVPKERTGAAMGLLGAMSATGTALGPALGGVLISGFGWPALLLINVPLGALTFLLARRSLPVERHPPKADRAALDPLGTLLLALTLTAYALAVTSGRGRLGPVNTSLLTAAAAGAALFLFAETKVKSPMIRLELFRDRVLSAGLAMGTLVSVVVMSTLVVGPFYLTRALGLDAAQVGLVLSVGPLVAALSGVPAGRQVDRLGSALAVRVGLVGMGAGCLLLVVMPESLGVASYLGSLVVITASYALFQAATTTAVMTDVPPDQRGVRSGLLNLSRNLGLITGASVMGAVFTLASATPDLATALPDAIARGTRITFLVGAGLIGIALGIAVGLRRQPVGLQASPARSLS
ncbi:MAG: MFS transporter [Opitutaceae bacterium]